MKLVTFRTAGDVRLGLVDESNVYDLTLTAVSLMQSKSHTLLSNESISTIERAQEKVPVSPFGSMLFFLNAWDHLGQDILAVAEEFLTLVKSGGVPEELDGDPLVNRESDVTLLSPLPRPTSLRDGYAFRQHVETMRKNRGVEMVPEFDTFPVFYFGNHQSVFGPGDFPVQRQHVDSLDYELEAAVVIGRTGRNIKAENADDYVFGLCIMNDMSARALQKEEMKLSLGPAKGKDFGTILGPYLVSLDELEDCTTSSPRGNSYSLDMTAALNDKPLSAGNLSSMNWTFAEIIERVSYGVTLHPGDVIGSGTVGTGCLAELNGSKVTDNLWLKPGDRISLEIERLGRLDSQIVLVEEEERGHSR